MNTKEVSEKFSIDLGILEYYENMGLLDEVKIIHGIRNYADKDIEKLSKIVTLNNLGLKISDISRYLNLINQGDLGIKERVSILRDYRQILLDEVHGKQKSIDCIDCIIYEIEGCNCGEKVRKGKLK